jgi:Fur family ferric uptake transcriptional regulator
MRAKAPTGRASRDTSQRRAIRQVLEASDRPLTAPEILEAAQVEVPGLGVATVYRTVKALQLDGLLHQVELPGDVPRYELSGKDHHHHFHCRMCKRVFEVEACPGELTHLTPPGFSLETHEVILYGRCATCAPRAEPRRAARNRGTSRG